VKRRKALVVTASFRDFSPAEMARRLGVSVKALRVYESRGLVTPRRTTAGWRVYGPAEIARLHQVLALKALGLSLAQVGELLAGRLAALDSVLALQETALRRRRGELDAALTLLGRARARLKAGETLSPDDISQLTKETVMSKPLSPEEYRQAFEPLWRKHLTADEIASLQDRGRALYSQADISRAWDEIFAEARSLMTAGDRTSPRARALLARWMALAEQFTGGDPELNRKTAEIWREALKNPELALRLPVDTELWSFVQSIAAAAA